MSLNIHSISPSKVIRGEGAWAKSIESINSLCKKPLIIGRSASTKELRISFEKDLLFKGIQVISFDLDNDCCELDVKRHINSQKRIIVMGLLLQEEAKFLMQAN